jgi:hypothetical protein
MDFVAVHESAFGTKPTSQDVRFEVRYRGQSGRQILKGRSCCTALRRAGTCQMRGGIRD